MSEMVTIPSAMMGDPDLTITLVPNGTDPWVQGKPGYTWSVSDGTYVLVGKDNLWGWGDAAEEARALCSFLANDLERANYSGDNTRDRSGDPIGPYTEADWAFLVAHSETLSMGSVEPDAD